MDFRIKTIWSLLKETALAWSDHEAPRMGAALAYYSVLSMAPLVVITIAIASFAFGQEAAQGQIIYQIRDIVGDAGAEVLQSILKNAHRPGSGAVASVIGICTLLVSASGVFGELRASLNRIWNVSKDAEPGGIHGILRVYAFSFALVLSIGFLLLVSLILSATLEVFEGWLARLMPSLPIVARFFNLLLSFTVISLLFACIYKFVPAVKVRWSEVRGGAIATATLFTIGKFGLAVYIGKMGIGSAYGAAGSLVAMLVWVYYSAQIFFFGAELTHVYAVHKRQQLRFANKSV